MMTDKRRTSTAEVKREAVRLVTDHGSAVAEAAGTLGLNAHLLRRWTCEVEPTKHGAFPGNGRVSRAHEELQRLRDEHKRRRMERDMLKKPWASLPAHRVEIRLDSRASPDVAGEGAVCRVACESPRLLRLQSATSHRPGGARCVDAADPCPRDPSGDGSQLWESAHGQATPG